MKRETILVAIGANLPDAANRPPLETCRWAVRRVASLPGLRLLACSRWWRSPAWPPSDQPDYVNGAMSLAGEADPESLLEALHGIENEAGRVRGAVNAARVLDLDLLAVDGERRSGNGAGGLVLPHPRLRTRAFVLAPLAEVAPFWRHPDGETVAELLARNGTDGLSVLAPAFPSAESDLAVQHRTH